MLTNKALSRTTAKSKASASQTVAPRKAINRKVAASAKHGEALDITPVVDGELEHLLARIDLNLEVADAHLARA